MAIINFGGTKERVITRKEFPLARARKVLKNETIAILGYGVQGPAQSLNLRDNGFKVIIGQASAFKRDWDRAVKDGWVPGKTLFEIDEAVRRGTIIQMLVSDAAQRTIWPTVKQNLKPGDALYFSHGFSIAYQKQTGVIPPKDVDVIMVAPKGSGLNVRRNFLTGAGINSSFAVEQDATGRAEERCLAVGLGIGSGYLALLVLKGGSLHRGSGMVFVFSMITLGVLASGIAAYERNWGSLFGGMFTAYFVFTGMTTVRPLAR